MRAGRNSSEGSQTVSSNINGLKPKAAEDSASPQFQRHPSPNSGLRERIAAQNHAIRPRARS